MPGVTSQLGERRREVGIGNVRNLTVVESKNVTRLVVGLNTLVPYTTRVEGNNVFVVLGDKVTTPTAVTTPVASTKPINTVKAAKSVVSTGNAIENIDFRRGDNGEGNIVVKLSNSTISPDVQEKGGKIVLNFPKTQLPESLRVRLDVKDFATPVQFINSTAKSEGSTISIEPKGNYDYLVFQANDELTVSVKHVSAEEKQRRLEDRSEGRTILNH